MAVKELNALSDRMSLNSLELINTNKLETNIVTTEILPTHRQPSRDVNNTVQSINLPVKPARDIHQQMATAFIGLARLIE